MIIDHVVQASKLSEFKCYFAVVLCDVVVVLTKLRRYVKSSDVLMFSNFRLILVDYILYFAPLNVQN